jgi:hypothetical protein
MAHHDLNILKQRFLLVANERGIEAAEREFLAALDPLHPTTAAVHRALLADLMQDADGKFFYRTPEATP